MRALIVALSCCADTSARDILSFDCEIWDNSSQLRADCLHRYVELVTYRVFLMEPGLLLLERPKRMSTENVSFLEPPMTQHLAATQYMEQPAGHWQDKTAKLSLKFYDNVLQEVALSGGVVTIGRQPDNLIRIDNPIVSGHHARIFWENNHYVLEDNESFNATYLNNRRVSRAALNDGDVIVIGKHRIEFHSSAGKRDVSSTSASQDRTTVWQAHVEKAAPPQLEATMVLDAGRLKQMMAKMAAAAGAAPVRAAGIALV